MTNLAEMGVKNTETSGFIPPYQQDHKTPGPCCGVTQIEAAMIVGEKRLDRAYARALSKMPSGLAVLVDQNITIAQDPNCHDLIFGLRDGVDTDTGKTVIKALIEHIIAYQWKHGGSDIL